MHTPAAKDLDVKDIDVVVARVADTVRFGVRTSAGSETTDERGQCRGKALVRLLRRRRIATCIG